MAFATVEELKENLIQEMDSGDRDKNLMLLIKMMENERITNFREIANGLLNMLKERRHVEFTVEKIRFLRQVIIAGHQQEGSRHPVENTESDEDEKSIMAEQGHGWIQFRQPRQEILKTESPLKLTIGSKLGEGHFGKVYKATIKMATKIQIGQSGQSALTNEIRILRLLKHENIVAFLGVCTSGALVMEWMDENLHQHIERKGGTLSIDSIMRFGINIANALEYLRQRHILHLDVKTKNLLVDNYPENVKLSDFGSAKVLTPYNREKEVLHYDCQSYGMVLPYYQSFKTDIWNFGWVLFEMAVGRPPNLKALYDLVQSKRRFPDIADLVAQCTLGVVPDDGLVKFQSFPKLGELVSKCTQIIPGGRPEILVARRIMEEHFQMEVTESEREVPYSQLPL